MIRVTAVIALIFACTTMGADALEKQGPEAIAKLKFMSGSWSCMVHGGASDGLKVALTYSFSADGRWMEERDAAPDGKFLDLQMWGYDATNQTLGAVQFTSDGVATKSVDGWVAGEFVSHRNDNKATVSIRPRDASHFDWVIVSADKTYKVVEACSR